MRGLQQSIPRMKCGRAIQTKDVSIVQTSHISVLRVVSIPHCNLRTSDVACSQLCYNQVSSWMSLLSTLVNLVLGTLFKRTFPQLIKSIRVEVSWHCPFLPLAHLRKVSKPYLSVFPIIRQKGP